MSVIHSTEAPPLGVRRLIAPVSLALALSVFLFRLWDLQIARSSELSNISRKFATVDDTTLPARGLIVDRNGATVASVSPTFVLYAHPDELRKKQNRGSIERLADLLGDNPYRMIQKIKQSTMAEPLAKGIGKDVANRINKNKT
ncbi:MAG: hypothetical protein ABUL72_03470, partial [Armatimonadota bacterium]